MPYTSTDAIKDAIKGGYDFFGTLKFPLAEWEFGRQHPFGLRKEDDEEFWRDIYTISFAIKAGGDIKRGTQEFYDKEIFTDPNFWIALGKTREWKERYGKSVTKQEWEEQAMAWFDAKMSNNETEFWESVK